MPSLSVRTSRKPKSFREQLVGSASRKASLLFLISCLLFVIGQFSISLATNEMNARRHLDTLLESFSELDEAERAFLEDPETLSAAARVLKADGTEDQTPQNEFYMVFRRALSGQSVVTNYMITSEDKRVIASSYPEVSFSAYSINYIYASCFRASQEGEGVYRTVYYDIGEYADPLYILPVRENGKVLGYVTLVLSGSSWNYMLSEKNYDGVITDLRSNVMYSSKHGLVTRMNKFPGKEQPDLYPGKHGACHLPDGRYWMVSRELPDRSAVVYSLVYDPQNGAGAAGLLIMLFAGVIWKELADGMARQMAAMNAASIDNLVREIRIIRKEDPLHRVQIDSEDEFSEVGMQINRMMDSIKELNDKNTELIRLNARFEMNELTEQMNPHFLYNTLEIIRNLVYFDADKANELIGSLTQILRYSVNNTRREVSFGEDMEYTDKYLQIQYTRFGDRLKCTMDIEPACREITVPKLLLQPIVENSIKYGFRHQMDLAISIRACMEDGIFTVRVADNGGGMDPEKARILNEQLLTHDNREESIGLRNLSRRLYLRYGPGSGLSIRNRENEGMEVILTINCMASGNT